MLSRKWSSVAAVLGAIALASASLLLAGSNTSLTHSSSQTQAELQLNPPLSVAWRFGNYLGNYYIASNDSSLTVGRGYGPIFNQVADGDKIYVTAGKLAGGAHVVAVSLASGKVLWDLKIPGSPDAKGTGLNFLNNDSGTRVLIVGVAGALLAVDDNQGKAIWNVSGSEGFPVAAPDGRVYTAAGAFWGNNGAKICGYQGSWILAYGDGRIYSMQESHQKGILTAFDAITCEKLWTTFLGPKGGHWASYWSAFRNGKVYATDEKSLYQIDANSGRITWNVTHGLGDFWPPTVSGGAVYLSGYAGADNVSGWKSTAGVAAFNATNGQLLWRSTPVLADFNTRPTVSGKLVYAANGCTLSAINSRTGKDVWKWSVHDCFGTGFFAYDGPLISGSYLVLNDDVSYLIVFRGTLS